MKSTFTGFLLFSLCLLAFTNCASLRDYHHAVKTGSIPAFERYLRNHPGSKKQPQVKQRLSVLYEERDWQAAVKNNTGPAYETFLREYPRSCHRPVAESEILRIRTGTAWLAAEKEDCAEAYQAFLSEFPHAIQAEAARKRFDYLQEQKAFENALAEGTLEAMQRFRSKYSQGHFFANAGEQMDVLKSAQIALEKARQTGRYHDYRAVLSHCKNCQFARTATTEMERLDDETWRRSKENASVEAYETYLQAFPEGIHTQEATRYIVEKEIEAIRKKGQYSNMPEMTPVESASGKHFNLTKIEITNYTAFQLTVRYAGPTARRLVFKPHETKTIELQKGVYVIAASLDAAFVQDYLSEENLQGGFYQNSYYINTSPIPGDPSRYVPADFFKKKKKRC